ncbi:MAG: DMT family transporter [Planctomycetota bacterium]|nr:DMT family transporter [Planctomycetota bacterium]
MAYEWLFIPAIASFLVATFVPLAAVRRQIQPAPLALLAMLLALLLTFVMGMIAAPRETISQLTDPRLIAVAVVGGAGGGLGLCFVFTALRQRATGPVITISSMSILLPIALGVSLGWDAPPPWWGSLGIALTLAGTALIHLGKSARPEGERFHWLPLALGALACFGVSQTAQKYVGVLLPEAGMTQRFGFMLAYYIAAVLVLGAFLRWLGQSINWRAWPFATGQALSSCVQFLSMLALLQHLRTAVVYISFTGGGIVLVLLISALVLRERYKPIVWLGCALGVAGIVLVRLK